MKERMVGGYRIKELFVQNMYSKLYKCVRVNYNNEEDELVYILKDFGSDKERAEYEKNISQLIESASESSITVTILGIEKESDEMTKEDNFYALLSFGKNGYFLSELIHNLEGNIEGNITISTICAIMKRIASALECLHYCLRSRDSQGVLHGDIHPGNIFLENCKPEEQEWGSAKFIDFENALLIDKKGKARRQGHDLGYTKGYYAPEMMFLSKDDLTEAADIYSLMAIFVRMLIGKDVENMYQFYEDELEEYYSGEKKFCENGILNSYVTRIVQLGLEINPDYRIKTAKSFKEYMLKLENTIEAIKSKNYYSLFEKAYEMDIDMPDCLEIVFDEKAYKECVNILKKNLLKDNIEVYKNLYIYQILREIGNIYNSDIEKGVEVNLLCSGIALYNHLGDSKNAIKCFEEIKCEKQYIHAKEWLELCNRVSVSYFDSFQTNKALDIINKNIEALEKVKKLYGEIMDITEAEETVSTNVSTLGKAYSAKGSYLAYQENDECRKFFALALKEFEDKGNKAITNSHAIHYELLKRNVEKFHEKYVEMYDKDIFHSNIIREYLETINKKQTHTIRWLYDLWIYVKAINVFGWGKKVEGIGEWIDRLMNDDAFYRKKEYPIHLIFKHCAEILYHLNGDVVDEKVKKLFEEAICKINDINENSNNGSDLMQIIGAHIKSRYYICNGQYEDARILYNEFMNHLLESNNEEIYEYNKECNSNYNSENNLEKIVPQIYLKYEYY